MSFDKNNIISASSKGYTKQELIDLINKNYPEDKESAHSRIATVTTVITAGGSVTQSMIFGKTLN